MRKLKLNIPEAFLNLREGESIIYFSAEIMCAKKKKSERGRRSRTVRMDVPRWETEEL